MKKKEKLYEFYVYVTRHGCYSETPVLHVGYQEYRPGRYRDEYDFSTWYSEPVNVNHVDSIYNKVHYLDGRNTSNKKQASDLIEKCIKDIKKL